MTNIRFRLMSLVLIGLFFFTACDAVVNPDAEARTFDEIVQMYGHGFGELEAPIGFTVDVQWLVVSQPQTDNLVTYLQVVNDIGDIILRDDVAVTLPQNDEFFTVSYTVRADTSPLVAGDYMIQVGWYYNTDPIQYMMVNSGTVDAVTTIDVFDFSVNEFGEIVLSAFAAEAEEDE